MSLTELAGDAQKRIQENSKRDRESSLAEKRLKQNRQKLSEINKNIHALLEKSPLSKPVSIEFRASYDYQFYTFKPVQCSNTLAYECNIPDGKGQSTKAQIILGILAPESRVQGIPGWTQEYKYDTYVGIGFPDARTIQQFYVGKDGVRSINVYGTLEDEQLTHESSLKENLKSISEGLELARRSRAVAIETDIRDYEYCDFVAQK